MSARPEPVELLPVFAPMTTADLDAVLRIEVDAYPFPWTRGNFVDSIAAGYHAVTLRGDAPDGPLLGYLVAMSAAGEVHLLNLTVAPRWQRRGHALVLLGEVLRHGRDVAAHQVWLEVRESNLRARTLYLRYGFRQIGARKGYYPAPAGRREDAIVMGLTLDALD